MAAAKFPDFVRSELPAAQGRALQGVLSGAVSDYAVSHVAGARGVAAGVVSDRGSWTGAAGTDGLVPVEPDAMMAVASITKTFVAAEVMRLAASGEVDLNAPLSRYIRHPLTANGATVRQVMSMRSGLTDPPDALLEAMVRAQAQAPAKPWSPQRELAYLRPGSAHPGRIPVYANTNYLLLGMLIETVTGRPLAEVERTDLFTPAGLRRIAAQDTERPIPPLASPPRRLFPARDGYLPSRAWAHSGQDSFSGIAADAETVAQWGYQLYGARLLDVASVHAMTTPPSADSIFPGIGYGLGTEVFDGLTTTASYGHIGEDPGYTSVLAVVPARHVAAAVLIPQGGRNPVAILRDLLAIVQ